MVEVMGFGEVKASKESECAWGGAGRHIPRMATLSHTHSMLQTHLAAACCPYQLGGPHPMHTMLCPKPPRTPTHPEHNRPQFHIIPNPDGHAPSPHVPTSTCRTATPP